MVLDLKAGYGLAAYHTAIAFGHAAAVLAVPMAAIVQVFLQEYLDRNEE